MPRGMGRGRGFCGQKVCVCPSCGETKQVGAGVPCRTVKCPKCGTLMVRS